MKKTRTQNKSILIEEYYSKNGEIVYWHWRFQNGDWHCEETPYKELPWITVNSPI